MDTNDYKGIDKDDNDVYLHKAIMHTGMIIRVKPLGVKDTKDIQVRKNETESYCESEHSLLDDSETSPRYVY
jgi:hypothetical protein